VTTLDSLFDAERAVRRAHAELLRGDRAALVPALKAGATDALAKLESDPDEAALRLVRISALLGECEGDVVVDTLVDILGCDEPEARHAAGEALEELAFDRFKEVALGVERALSRLPSGSPALSELPYLLAEVGEPGSVKLLARFLQHKDAEAVAAAIEALVELGDPNAAHLLAPLEKDGRQVQIDEGEERVAIGDLAMEAGQLLAELEGGKKR
jgi:HEAT repeat protein